MGAAALILATTAALSGCADDPKDKAFGGLGDLDDAPSVPSGGPSLDPSMSPSDIPSLDPGASSGGSTDLPSSPTSPAAPTYDSDALGEVVGKNCRYSRATSQIKFDVDIQNSSSDTSFTYSFSVQFKIGSSPSSSVATDPIGSDFDTMTVAAGSDRSATMEITHSTSQRLAFSCQVTRASKVPSS
ncbi:hypothetical protein OIE63_34305 [Streptomyces sp. NBC_01795]|nr:MULTISPECIES: hypothetical protein [unclassified Streptomyces]WSA96068.1 hypothetical protein OIE63_34305 [Streptomyces sp. NBC_01795]WSS11310.1 hypothetical protein OG533_04845 [Streptomyces sp. NBC_01186]